MATQTQADGSDLWFVTNIETHKLEELEYDPQVNLAYYKDRTREWVSVSGLATVTQDRQLIHELWKKDWQAWFGSEAGERDGGPEDPRLALILVDIQSVIYLKLDKPQPVVLFEVAKAMVTGTTPKLGAQRTLTGPEIERER